MMSILSQRQLTTTRPLTTAHLAQTMTLLGLTGLELRQKIEIELAKNPALELIEDRYCPSCQRHLASPGPCPICSRPQNQTNQDPIVFVSPREDMIFSGTNPDIDDDANDEYPDEREDLATYVLQQIAPELTPNDYKMTIHLLTSLDEDGLLRTPLIEIAQFHHIPLSRIEQVRHIIQRADPIGVCSLSPKEALLVQLEVLSETTPVPELASKVIDMGLEYLSRHQYSEIAKLLNVNTSEIKNISEFISNNLNPYPARAYWGEIHQNQATSKEAYYQPDIIITQLNQDEDSPLVIEVISPLAGKLRVNPLFKEALHNAPENKVEEWQQDLDKASLLVKCIQQRNHTIVRLMQDIATNQKEFILKGDAYLIPMTRAVMARILDVHESTISRAVSSKTVQLPNRKIVPLAKFFDRSLHIRTELLKIIATETKPLTDTELVNVLTKKGYNIARRTVAKYRSIEGIMPAYLRAKFQNHSKSIDTSIRSAILQPK